jgi:hypothetical protein
MGWYTSGPSGQELKHGDARGAAIASGLGALAVLPTLDVRFADEEAERYAPSDLRERLSPRGLPFPTEEELLNGLDPRATAADLHRGIASRILAHLASIFVVEGDPAPSLVREVGLGLAFAWAVPDVEHEALLAWIQERLPPAHRLTLAALAEGSVRQREYHLPPGHDGALLLLDDPRRLALLGLGAALASRESFPLEQPDDDFEATIWPPGQATVDGLAAVPLDATVFAPSDHPAITAAARACGLEERHLGLTLFAYAGDGAQRPSLPIPDPSLDPPFHDRALQLARFVASGMMPFVRAPGTRVARWGYHASAPRAEVALALRQAGLHPCGIREVAGLAIGDVSTTPGKDLAGLRRRMAKAPLGREVIDYVQGKRERPEVAQAFMLMPLLHYAGDGLGRDRERLARFIEWIARSAAAPT